MLNIFSFQLAETNAVIKQANRLLAFNCASESERNACNRFTLSSIACFQFAAVSAA